MIAMFGQVLGVPQNIINVNQDDFVEVLSENLIHETLDTAALALPWVFTRPYSMIHSGL